MEIVSTELKPARAPRMPQVERRSRSEQRIIGAALHLIARNGLHGLTLGEAGEAAGYSRGLPVHLFGTKAELLRRCALSVTGEVWRGAERSDGGIDAAIAGWVDLLRTGTDFARAYFMLAAAALQSPESAPFAQVMRDFSHHTQQHFEALLTASARDDLRRDAPTRAWLLHAALRGIGLQWLLRPDLVDLNRLTAELRRFL